MVAQISSCSRPVDRGSDPTACLLTEPLYIFQPIFDRGITAKQVTPRKLSRLIDGLVGAGLPKNVARALVCVASKGEITSAGIEGATGLRQPEVSIAVQELRQRGWVAKRDIKKIGKGRPIHSYRLSVTLKEILRVFEAAEDEKVKLIEANLKVLRELLELE